MNGTVHDETARMAALALSFGFGVFIFLFSARVPRGGAAGAGDSLSMVILLDASYSMQGRIAGVSRGTRSAAGGHCAEIAAGQRPVLVVFRLD